MLLVERRASAAAGDTVTLRGLNFGRRAEIRFNGLSGPLLKSASGQQFKVKVRVPRVPAGLYTLVGLERDQSGGVSGTASTAIEVAAGPDGPAPSPPPARLPKASDTSSEGVSPALAAGGGFGLLLLGGLTGALIARRRRHRPDQRD